MQLQNYIGCPDCDLLHRRTSLPPRGVAVCSRCGAELYRRCDHSLDRTLALAVSGIVFFLIANLYPFLSLSSEGRVQETVLISGIVELYSQDMRLVAVLVLATGVVSPLFILVALVYLLAPLKLGHKIWGFAPIFRFVQKLQPWSMMEVFLLGILVAMVKLIKMAVITPGMGLYAFLILVFLFAAIAATMQPEKIWEQVSVKR